MLKDIVKVYKVELLIVDHDGIGSEEICTVLENTKYPNWCIYPEVMNMDRREIEWSDDHPINKSHTRDAAYQRLFGPNEVLDSPK